MTMERCPIYILQHPQPRVHASRDGASVLLSNHDEGHQPHIALKNDSPLRCGGYTWRRYIQRDHRAGLSCKPPPNENDYNEEYSTNGSILP